MWVKKQPTIAAPFITTELRPNVGSDLEGYVPLAPGVPREEIQKRAGEVIAESERSGFQLPEPPSPEIWQTRFTKSTDVVCKVLDGEGVLLNLDNGFYYTLNRVGTVIWEMFTGDRSLEEVLTIISSRFDVAEKRARDDLVALVTRLRHEGLILKT